MTWTHVNEMLTGNIAFGSHSTQHKILTKIPLDQAKREIEESRMTIQQNTKKQPDIFCFPNGAHSHELLRIVEETGYKAALSTIEGRLSETSDRYSLPRVNIHQGATDTIPLFLSKILGIF
jgi:peptidoglycan/xylan/chitin deacetylase (PgdA/CDA1 family)